MDKELEIYIKRIELIIQDVSYNEKHENIIISEVDKKFIKTLYIKIYTNYDNEILEEAIDIFLKHMVVD